MALTRLLAGALLVVAALPAQQTAQTPAKAAGTAFADLPALMASLPAARVTPLDAQAALVFTALPLTCLDDLQPRPNTTRAYFWQPTYRTVDAYDKTRAFYGCNDWPTAVSATWTLVALLKTYPDVGSSQLIREKLGLHLGHDNLDGELTYYKAAGNAQRPYGYAWFLRLYADLATWKDPDGTRYADNAAPLARYFVDGTVSYLVDLERPNRSASQANTALSLALLLDYVDVARDNTIKRAAGDAAKRLYLGDADCATETEAAAPEMVSPCLEEAAVMSRVLDAAAFAAWFDKFLPPMQSAKFTPLRAIDFDATGGRGRGNGRATGAAGTAAPDPNATPAGAGRGPQTSPRTNWIGLAFTRAQAYATLAAALPASDPRAAVFKRLADIHAASGEKAFSTAAAFDAPWVGALAVTYLTSNGAHK